MLKKFKAQELLLEIICKMKFKYISDVHLEFSRFPLVSATELNPSSDEYLFVAGDTIPSTYFKKKRTDKQANVMRWRFDEFLDTVSGFKKIIMIGGNHEHYHGDLITSQELIQTHIDGKYSNIQYIENQRVELSDDYALLGCTLWTDFNKDNPSDHMLVQYGMNDFKVCNYKGTLFTTHVAYDLHKESVAFIENEVKDESKKYIVMTHHLPSFRGIDPVFKGDPLNYGYASELDLFIEDRPQITHWIHGHTHYDTDYYIGKTNVISRQRGYPPMGFGENRGNWKDFKVNAAISI